MSKVVFFTGFFLVAAVAVALSSLTCEKAGDAVPTPAPRSEKQQTMDAAYEHGEVVFVYHKVEEGIALCVGTQSIITLTDVGREYRIKLTSNEMLNLSLCKRNAETGNYFSFQNLNGTSPGDYLLWNVGGGLEWTYYTPPVVVITANS